MLLRDQVGLFYFVCDACGKESGHFSTLEELKAATYFGNDLYTEPVGWCNGRGTLQVTADDALSDDLYSYQRVQLILEFILTQIVGRYLICTGIKHELPFPSLSMSREITRSSRLVSGIAAR